MPPYRAVLFDFFGTLTHAVIRGPWHEQIARSLGCDPAEFRAVLDRSFPARARGSFGSAEAALRWVCDQVGVDPSPRQLRAALKARVAAVRADTRLRPDAIRALATVRALRARTALVSDCAYELPAFLPDLPVAALLDTCVYSVMVGQCKPHPALYATACQRLGVAPQECLYVGDGGGRELTGAVAVGMTAVRLAAPDLDRHLVFSVDREFAGPSVRSLAEAVRLLHSPPTPRPVDGAAWLAVTPREDGRWQDGAMTHPLVDQAMKKAPIAWISVEGRPALALWCLPAEGALYLVSGPGEQAAPGLATASQAEVTLRGDHGGRIVTWPAAVTRVTPGTQQWDDIAPQLAGKRLNAPGDAEAVVARWAAECTISKLAPAGDPVEAGSTLPGSSLAEPPRDTLVRRRTRRPFRLHRVRRR